MKIRAITNEDLKVAKGWLDTRKRQRVFVSLKGSSFVNKTYWLLPADQARPETLARVKRDLQSLLEVKMKGLEKFLATDL